MGSVLAVLQHHRPLISMANLLSVRLMVRADFGPIKFMSSKVGIQLHDLQEQNVQDESISFPLSPKSVSLLLVHKLYTVTHDVTVTFRKLYILNEIEDDCLCPCSLVQTLEGVWRMGKCFYKPSSAPLVPINSRILPNPVAGLHLIG